MVLDNKSNHEATVTVEGRAHKLHPQQIVYADVSNSESLNVKIEHKYVSYIDCQKDYVIVITSEYGLNGVRDGEVLSISHDRSKFGNNGVYERFFVKFPNMNNSTQKHTVTNFKELYKPFKREKRLETFLESVMEAMMDLLYPFSASVLFFVVFWITYGIKKALLISLGIFIAGILLYWIVEKLFNRADNSVKHYKRRKGENVEETLFIEDLKGVCKSEAISAYYADPYRNIISSKYEG